MGKWAAYEVVMEDIFRELGYEPSLEQWQFHRDRHRVRLVIGGERAGKSFSAAKDALVRSQFTVDGSPGHFWIVGPDYNQARPEFDYVLEDFRRLGKEPMRVSQPQSLTSPWSMEFKDGEKWETRTSSDVRKLASFAVDGVVMAEAAQQDYGVFLKLRGRLAQRRAWMIMTGTLESGMTWYSDCYTAWQAPNKIGAKSFSLPSWSNLSIYPGGRLDPEILALEGTMPADYFMERFGAVPCKPHGLVFKEFDFATHVQELPKEDMPVELAIDPGYTGAYAVLVLQEVGGLVWVVDEVYSRFDTAQDVIAKCRERWWWELRKKTTDNKTGGVIDIAGKQHHGLPSHVEIWQTEAKVALRCNPVSIEDGILGVRNLLRSPKDGSPRVIFSSELSTLKDFDQHPLGILTEFDMYRYPDRTANQNTTDLPIDKYNHAVKALGYWEYDKHGPVGGRKKMQTGIVRSYWR